MVAKYLRGKKKKMGPETHRKVEVLRNTLETGDKFPFVKEIAMLGGKKREKC